MIKYYSYVGCGTCHKAKSWLADNNIVVSEIAIREKPPAREELSLALQSGYSIRQLFNSSGKDYRDLELKNVLPEISQSDALEMLHLNGNLVKRPFLISSSGALVGFKLAEWEKFFKISQ